MRDALESVDYDVVPHQDAETYKVRLLTGQYAMVEYVYGNVSIQPDEDEDIATLSFNYEIVKAPDGIITNSSDFEAVAGWVLQSLLARISSDAYLGKKENDDADRNVDSEEPAD